MVRLLIRAQAKKLISTWIFRVKPIGLVAFLALAGCGGGFGGSVLSTSNGGYGNSLFGALTGYAGQREATIGGAGVKIAGPEGFCIDPKYRKASGDTAFVLLASCAAITGSSRAQAPSHPAVLLASVGGPTSSPVTENLNDLDGLLRSETGRELLSRANDPSTVEVLESFAMDDTLFLRVRDTSPNDQPGLADEYWRAITDIKGSGVTLSVMGSSAQPIKANQGLEIVRSYVTQVKARNGEGPASEPLAQQIPQSVQAQPVTPPSITPLSGIGILRRLLS